MFSREQSVHLSVPFCREQSIHLFTEYLSCTLQCTYLSVSVLWRSQCSLMIEKLHSLMQVVATQVLKVGPSLTATCGRVLEAWGIHDHQRRHCANI